MGDGNIIKELHRTIQFSKPCFEGEIEEVAIKDWSWDSDKEPETGL